MTRQPSPPDLRRNRDRLTGSSRRARGSRPGSGMAGTLPLILQVAEPGHRLHAGGAERDSTTAVDSASQRRHAAPLADKRSGYRSARRAVQGCTAVWSSIWSDAGSRRRTETPAKLIAARAMDHQREERRDQLGPQGGAAGQAGVRPAMAAPSPVAAPGCSLPLLSCPLALLKKREAAARTRRRAGCGSAGAPWCRPCAAARTRRTRRCRCRRGSRSPRRGRGSASWTAPGWSCS